MALWTTADVAAELAVSEDWVRDHAGDLGAIRIGDPRRGPLRFEPDEIAAYKQSRRVACPPAARPEPEDRRKIPAGVELLPIP